MSSEIFKCSSFGKWILTGEHAVLRGGGALVFPVKSKKMSFEFTPGEETLDTEVRGESAEILKPFLGALITKTIELTGRSPDELLGKLKVDNQIPLGSGMGGSAALSVNLARTLEWQGWITPEQIFETARSLEGVAHGQSSGADIAIVMEGKGISFKMSENPQWKTLDIQWSPQLYLVHSGQTGMTAASVNKVSQKFANQPDEAKVIDELMAESVVIAKKSLTTPIDSSFSQGQAFELLSESISKGFECFEKWELITSPMYETIEWMRSNGAIVCKPVGSGGGGFIVGLWNDPPKESIKARLTSCSLDRSAVKNKG